MSRERERESTRSWCSVSAVGSLAFFYISPSCLFSVDVKWFTIKLK